MVYELTHVVVARADEDCADVVGTAVVVHGRAFAAHTFARFEDLRADATSVPQVMSERESGDSPTNDRDAHEAGLP